MIPVHRSVPFAHSPKALSAISATSRASSARGLSLHIAQVFDNALSPPVKFPNGLERDLILMALLEGTQQAGTGRSVSRVPYRMRPASPIRQGAPCLIERALIAFPLEDKQQANGVTGGLNNSESSRPPRSPPGADSLPGVTSSTGR